MSGDLRVERVRISILAAPIDEKVAMSFASLTERRACIVEIEAGGVCGIGESWINYPQWAPQERLATFGEGVLPLILGADAGNPAAVHAALERKLNGVGRQWGAPGPVAQAISAIDIALWDIKGKAEGRSIAQLLAADGFKPTAELQVYASGIGPDRVGEFCIEAVSLGLDAVKVKLGFGRERDIETLRTARDVIGARTLLCDSNQGWALDEALDMLGPLTTFDAAWIEEPLAGDDLRDLRVLAEHAPMAIAVGENIYGMRSFEDYISSGAVGVIQPDIAKCGGFTVAQRVSENAASQGVRLAPHSYASSIGVVASLHLAAACATGDRIELDVRANPLRTDLLGDVLALHDGRLRVPTGPGLGVELNLDTVDKYRTHELEVAA